MVLGSDVSDLRNVSLMKIRSQGGLPSRIPASYACHRQALHELHGRVTVVGTRADSGEQPGTRRKLAVIACDMSSACPQPVCPQNGQQMLLLGLLDTAKFQLGHAAVALASLVAHSCESKALSAVLC